MKPLSLPATVLIRKPWEYREIYSKGQRLRGNQCSIIWLPNGTGEARLGISVHGVKSAVRRNRIKRIIREFFRLNRHSISPAVDLVFAVRDGFEPDSPAAVANEVQRLLNRHPAKAFRLARSIDAAAHQSHR